MNTFLFLQTSSIIFLGSVLENVIMQSIIGHWYIAKLESRSCISFYYAYLSTIYSQPHHLVGPTVSNNWSCLPITFLYMTLKFVYVFLGLLKTFYIILLLYAILHLFYGHVLCFDIQEFIIYCRY